MSRHSIWKIIIALTLLTMGCGLALAEPVIVHSKQPSQPARTIVLEEEWRTGGEDGDIIFGMMIDCVQDPEGNIYMLDNQLGQVEIFSPDGEHLRTISGQGEGPGEVRIPQNLVMLADDTLGILELFPGSLVTMQLDGTPGETILLGGGNSPQTGFNVAFNCIRRGDTIVMAAQHSTQIDQGQSRTQYVARFSPTGEELARFRQAETILDFTNFEFSEAELLPPFLLATTVDDLGRAYMPSSREEYAIEVFAPDGSLEKVISRDFESWKRDDRDMRRMNSLVDAWLAGAPANMERNIEPIEPAITELQIDKDGVLWVLHSRSNRDQAEGVLLTYDTFAPDGTWLAEVSFQAEGDGFFDGLKFLDDGRVLLIRGYALARWSSRGAQNADFGDDGADGPMEIICCRMVE